MIYCWFKYEKLIKMHRVLLPPSVLPRMACTATLRYPLTSPRSLTMAIRCIRGTGYIRFDKYTNARPTNRNLIIENTVSFYIITKEYNGSSAERAKWGTIKISTWFKSCTPNQSMTYIS